MPTSKRPRKKGKYGLLNANLRKLRAGRFKDQNDADRTIAALEKSAADAAMGRRHYEWMSVMLDHEELIEGFVRAHQSLDRIPTTFKIFDFNILCSSLMLGAMVHMRLGIEEQSWITDIRRAAYGTIMAYRLRGMKQDVPEANLNMIGIGLTAAQELIEYAFKEDPQALKEVLLKNDPLYTRAHPEENEARERFILGDRYDQVKSWKLTEIMEFN